MFCEVLYNYAEVMFLIVCKYWDTARELLSNFFFALLCYNLLHNIWCSGWYIYNTSGMNKDICNMGFK